MFYLELFYFLKQGKIMYMKNNKEQTTNLCTFFLDMYFIKPLMTMISLTEILNLLHNQT